MQASGDEEAAHHGESEVIEGKPGDQPVNGSPNYAQRERKKLLPAHPFALSPSTRDSLAVGPLMDST